MAYRIEGITCMKVWQMWGRGSSEANVLGLPPALCNLCTLVAKSAWDCAVVVRGLLTLILLLKAALGLDCVLQRNILPSFLVFVFKFVVAGHLGSRIWITWHWPMRPAPSIFEESAAARYPTFLKMVGRMLVNTMEEILLWLYLAKQFFSTNAWSIMWVKLHSSFGTTTSLYLEK